MNNYKKEILNKICYTELVYGRINKKLNRELSKQEIEDLISTIPDNEGAITVPTIMVKLLTNSSVKTPKFDIFFILKKYELILQNLFPSYLIYYTKIEMDA